MYKLVLLRHEQSVWNLENRFTGWTDVDLSGQGRAEARAAGKLLRESGYEFDLAFTSVLKRAIRTLNLIQEEMDLDWLPVTRAWQLNERLMVPCRDSIRPRRLRSSAKHRSRSGAALTMSRLPRWN